MAEEVAKAYVTVMPSVKGAQSAVEKAVVPAAGSAGTKAGNTLGTGLVAGVRKHAKAIVAAASFGAVIKEAKKAVSSFDSLATSTKQLQRVTGGSAEDVSSLAGAIRLSGVDSSKATSALTIFAKNMNKAAEGSSTYAQAFEDLGVSVTDSSGNLRDMGDILPELADKFTTMEDGAKKTATATTLFGRSGSNIVPFLNKGSEGIEELEGKAKELGIVLDDQSMNTFSDYKTATRELSTALEGLGVKAGEAIAPFVSDAASAIETVFIPMVSGAVDTFTKFADALSNSIDTEGFSQAWQGITDAIDGVFGEDAGYADAAEGFGKTVGDAINGLIPMIENATPIVEGIAQAVKWFGDNADWLIPAIGGIATAFGLMKVVSAISGPLSTVVNTIGGIVGKCAGASTALFATAAGEEAVGTASATSAGETLSMAAAVIALGAGIALACAGMWLLVQAAVQLVDAGPMSAVAMLGLVAAIGALAVVFAALGPELTAGSIGMVAFGAAVLMVGAGVMLACTGITLLCTQLPTIVEYGPMAAVGLLAIGGAALGAAPGLLALGGAAAVFGVSGLVAGVAAVMLGGGLAICAAAAPVCATNFMLMAAIAPTLASALPGVGAGALEAAGGLAALMVPLGACVIPLGLYAAAMWPAASNTEKFGYWITEAAKAVSVINMCLPLMRANAQPAADAMKVLADAGEEVSPSLQATSDALSPMASAFVTAATSSMTAATALLSMDTTVKALQASVTDMATSAKSAFSELQDSAKTACASASMRITTFVLATQAAIAGMRLQMPQIEVGKLPHFTLTGSFDASSGSVPQVGVEWYASGGVATKATVVGVGEAGPEAIVPLDSKTLSQIGEGMEGDSDLTEAVEELSRILKQSGGSLNLYMDGEKVASTIASPMNKALAKVSAREGI